MLACFQNDYFSKLQLFECSVFKLCVLPSSIPDILFENFFGGQYLPLSLEAKFTMFLRNRGLQKGEDFLHSS